MKGKNTTNLRLPVVAVLGHVDHGKTTLLDFIRKSRIQAKEIGGITQSIGASVVTTPEGKRITFIDTPGHAAFSSMRESGVTACDIALLVVAADDGVKPQTKEAISQIRQAKVPFIVVVTKVDLPTANLEGTLQELEKEEIFFEGRGGNIPYISVSAKTGEKIDELLELITLVFEVSDINKNTDESLIAIVIETELSKGGPLVSAVVRSGKLSVGDLITSSGFSAKVRGLFDHNRKSIAEANAGEPVQILGFANLPKVGDSLMRIDSLKSFVDKPTIFLDKKVGEDGIAIVVKASTSGSLQAVLENLPPKVVVIESGVGNVTENDIFMAKSSKSLVFAFEVSVGTSVRKLAETEGVDIFEYDLIYKLFEKLDDLLKEKQITVVGKAKIIAIFPFNQKKVAGCKVLEGEIGKVGTFYIERNNKKVSGITIRSIKKQKNDIEIATQGEECGIIFSPQLDFMVGDVIVSVRI